MTLRTPANTGGFTVAEVLTALIVLGVLIAIAIPMWRNHQLRTQRAEAIAMLVDLQKAQDLHFGRHARYAAADQLSVPAPAGLGLETASNSRSYLLDLHVTGDGLGYLATARARPGGVEDSRCAALSIDQNGRRSAVDAAGEDRSADCWR